MVVAVANISQAIGASVSPTMLSLFLNGRTFFQLSDMIEHIHDYPVGLERMELYCDAVEQTAALFEIGSGFASDLMKAVKKDKSWRREDWASVDVNELVAPLACHVSVDRKGRNCREETLKTLNKH